MEDVVWPSLLRRSREFKSPLRHDFPTVNVQVRASRVTLVHLEAMLLITR